MNISQNTLSALGEMFTFNFLDGFVNDVPIDRAIELRIGFAKEGNELMYIGKSIKATKKEMTLDYILNKVSQKSIFTNFTEYFKKLLNQNEMNAYPTTYGIGVFVFMDYRGQAKESQRKIEEKLTSLGVKFTTEYSEAGWVFRYRISQSKENIELIKSLTIK